MRQVIRRLAVWVGSSAVPDRIQERHTAPGPVAPVESPADCEPFTVRPYVLAHEERVRQRRRRLRRNLTLVPAGLYLTVGVVAL